MWVTWAQQDSPGTVGYIPPGAVSYIFLYAYSIGIYILI